MVRRNGWTARTNAVHAAPSVTRITIPWLVRTSLCGSFLIAFLQYKVNSPAALFIPIILIGACGLFVLSGRQRTLRMQHILSGGGLLFTAILFGEVVSYTSHDSYSIAYGLVFAGLFLCARLIVQEIGVPNVIRAYSQAGILTVAIMLTSGRQALFEGSRFSGGTHAHPDLVAFVLGGYFPVILWRGLEEKEKWRKRIYLGLSFATLAFIFLTGSRGSLGAVVVAAGIMVLRGFGAGWFRKFRLRHLHAIVILFLMPLAMFFLIHNHRIEHIADHLNDFLELKTSGRGLNSGLSGRTLIWKIAFRILRTQDRWLFGFGYRAGDRLVGTIDNGYVQLLFESGLIAGSMILGSMIRVFALLWKASKPRENNAWTRYYMVLCGMMIIYFLNNISARYLFSFGSPFSLCILCLMAASRRELIGGGIKQRIPQPQVAPPPRVLAWSRSVE
jgi:O-antigen ligase